MPRDAHLRGLWLPKAKALLVLLMSIGVEAPAAAAACSVSPQGVDFGPYDPLSASPLDTVGNVSIRCDTAVAATVAFGIGNGTYGERRMAGPAAGLAYNLYTDASRTIVWGDGSGGTGTASVSAASADIPVYARAPARQNVPAGSFADVVVVTITY